MASNQKIRFLYTYRIEVQNKDKINASLFTTFRSAVDSFLSTYLLREIAVINAVSDKAKSRQIY